MKQGQQSLFCDHCPAQNRGGILDYNALVIHHREGPAVARSLEAEVVPISVEDGILMLQREPTPLGDANLDYALDITDPIAILNTLFLGADEIICAAAADYNLDGRTNISDPIAILRVLFLGDPARGERVLCQ